MKKARIIMHIDLNAFFATAEVIKNPDLKGKPVVVAGLTKRGIVSTASYEARKFGIHSAMPTYMAKKLCPQVIIVSSSFRLYRDLSYQFFSFIGKRTSIIEIASIDECYADMTDVLAGVADVYQYLKDMQDELLAKLQLPCSIGIGPTKFLAKMASDMKKPLGITILRKRDLASKLWTLDIEKMLYIGKKTAPKLRAIGIKTIGDLVKDDSLQLKNTLGVSYYHLKNCAIGKSSDVVDVSPFDPKSISHSSTFLDDTNDYEEIKAMIKDLAQEVSLQAIKDEKVGMTVQITIKDADFTTHNRSLTLKKPLNDFKTLFNQAMVLFDRTYKDQPIRLVGVGLQNLTDIKDSIVQMSLFDYSVHEEEAKTKLLVDSLNRKLSKPVLTLASRIKPKKAK